MWVLQENLYENVAGLEGKWTYQTLLSWTLHFLNPITMQVGTLQSICNATRYNMVVVVTRPGIGSETVIFLQFLYKIIPL